MAALWPTFHMTTPLTDQFLKIGIMQSRLFQAMVIAACVLTSSCRTASKSKEASIKIEAQLADYLPRIAPWPDGDDPFPPYGRENWTNLIALASILQTNAPKSVEEALYSYQMKRHWPNDFMSMTDDQLHDDGKLFLMMKLVFNLPEAQKGPKGQYAVFGGWIRPQYAWDINGVHNWSWPVQWNNGNPKLFTGYLGFSGIDARYSAAVEYKYCLKRFPMRDLSVTNK
jgi:hypothetical protein